MTGISWRGNATQQRVLSLEALGALLLFGGAAYLLQRRSVASGPASDPDSADTGNSQDTPRSNDAADVSAAPASRASETDAEEAPSTDGFRVHTERLTVDETLGTGPHDGAWWPTSENASEAVVGLVQDLGDHFGRVTRIALPMSDWSDEQPKTVQVDGRSVHLAWFAGMQRRTARVTNERDEAITVVVLPVDSEKEAASSALSLAAEDRSSADLLQEAGATTSAKTTTEGSPANA
jgi:hypothetical protein